MPTLRGKLRGRRVAELVIEIGFEEMPAPWLSGLAGQLRARFLEAASREFLEAQGAAVAWTPRRLVLRAELPARQPDREEQVWGPALKLAKDAGGGWTAAAQGFARKNNVQPDELQLKPRNAARPDELNLLYLKRVDGRATSELMPALLSGVLRALAFPKRMSWDAWLEDGRGAFPFGRPIRWLALVLDGVPLPFAIYALERGARGAPIVESRAETRGHRFLPRGAGAQRLPVRSFSELRDSLRDRFVLVDPDERAARIDEGLRSAAAAGAFDDHGLRAEWRDLVEYPTVMVGQVPQEFHGLPSEVLETVLVHHQKYIALRDAGGRIDRFAAVTNGDGASTAAITRGMQRVVVARLRDAAFFLAEDAKRPLPERVSDLSGVTFHHGLGSYRDKSARMVALVEEMGRQGLLSARPLAAARQAAGLAKADLVTLMVREFPELQGVMGGIYLEAAGVPESVASAVRFHYHPIAVEPDAAPAAAFAGRDEQARVFAAVSIADKLDTLAGYFGIGENPTGSRDPYGLRRAAQGAVRAVLDFWRPAAGEAAPDLQALAAAAVRGYPSLPQPADATTRSVEAFLLERLEYVLSARGLAPDEVSAAVQAPDAAQPSRPAAGAAPLASSRALANPIDAQQRALALQHVRRELPEDLSALAEAFKRAKNIVAQGGAAGAVDPALFEADAERALHAAVVRLGQQRGSYQDRLRGLAALRAPVARFFDDVLVMADDPRVRANRLALLDQTLTLFYQIADISRLGGTS